MSNEVCRAITFINYHIPIPQVTEKEIDYSAVGFFDGMMTEAIKMDFSKDDLTPLWEHSMKNLLNNSGHYSHQNIFVFSEDEWNKVSDEFFWGEKQHTIYPLTFVVFLQLQNYEVKYNAIERRCMEFSDLANQTLGDDGIAYAYCTIDKNDFVVCLKCMHYETAVRAIKILHNVDNPVVYSYSIFTIAKQVLSNLSKENYPVLYEQQIDSISLKGITNSIDFQGKASLDRVYREFCEQLVERLYGKAQKDNKLYDILGDDDFRFIARDVNLGILLSQFSNGGLLCYYEEKFRKYLFSSNLVLNTNTPDLSQIGGKILENDADICNKESSPKCDKLQETLKKIIDRTIKDEDFKGDEEAASYLYAIWQILQSLKALEAAPVKKYDFWSLYEPLSMLIKILEGKEDITKNRYLPEFIQKISMTLHGTLRTDIQFFQIKDFNVIVHYEPAKLRAFYSLWATEVKDFYNKFCSDVYGDNLQNYSFVFSPGMFKEVYVRQLYENYGEEHRLMLISVPERSLYSLQWTPIIVAHEVSHFSGREVRARQLRHITWLKCCARLLTLELEYFRYDSVKDIKWAAFLQKAIAGSEFYNKLAERMEKVEQDVRKDELNMKHPFHSGNSQKIIEKTLQKIVQVDMEYLIVADSKNLQKLMKTAMGFDKLPLKEQLDTGEILRQITYARDDKLQSFVAEFQGFSRQILEIFKYLTVECHADLMAVLTLELSPETYLRSFTDSSVMTGTTSNQNQYNNTLVVRLGLVMETIQSIVKEKPEFYQNTDFVGKWSGMVLEDLAKNMCMSESVGSLAAMVYSYCRKFKDDVSDQMKSIGTYVPLYNRKKQSFTNTIFAFLNDHEIWSLLHNYLCSCAEKYVGVIKKDNDIAKKQQNLRDIYRDLTGDSVIGAIQRIEDFLGKNRDKE